MLRDVGGSVRPAVDISSGIHPSDVAVILIDLGHPVAWINRRVVGRSETGWVAAWIGRRLQEHAPLAVLLEHDLHP
jgi:hypothetical protein